MKKIVFYLCILIIFVACGNSKSAKIKNETTAFIAHKEIDFGILTKDIAKDTIVLVENVGNTPLYIQDVETSCGCTTSNWTKKPIASGQSGKVTITYDSEFTGHFHKTIMIFANVNHNPMVLQIMGEVVNRSK